VYDAIADHLRQSGRRAHRNWEVTRAHEDSLTGAAFSDFHTQRTRRVDVEGQKWRWRVRARKFGSGGRGSEEKRTGADGIVEVEVRHFATGHIDRKALLVQAKKEWSGKDSNLFDQVRKMEGIAPGCSAAIDYTERGYQGIDGREVLSAEGDRRRLSDTGIVPLGDFLADRFLLCKVGCRGLYYDPRRHLLIIPPQSDRPDALTFMIPERMRIEIEEIMP
jgi:hypothetical protein